MHKVAPMYKKPTATLQDHSAAEATDVAMSHSNEAFTRALMAILSAFAVMLGAAAAIHTLSDNSAGPNAKDVPVTQSEMVSTK
jgi:hypothetical protein